MTAAILTILGAVIPFAIWWIRRAASKRDDPSEIRRRHSEAIAREVITDNTVSTNRRMDDWLRSIQSYRKRQADSARKSGPDDKNRN